MPFKSLKQSKACFATHGFGNKIDCKEWAAATNYKNMKNMGGRLRPKACMECGGATYQMGGFPVTNSIWEQPSLTPTVPAPAYPGVIPPIVNPNGGGKGEGYLNQGLTPPTPAEDANAVNPHKKKTYPVDPYFAFRGFTNGLAWLSGIVDRRRQNQYMQAQMANLGQNDAMPVEDFQPNPFSLYAKYGGSLKKYQTGGRTPITVTNPNDPRLKAYQDSLILYKNQLKKDAFYQNNSAYTKRNSTTSNNDIPNLIKGIDSVKNNLSTKQYEYLLERLAIDGNFGSDLTFSDKQFKEKFKNKYKKINDNIYSAADILDGRIDTYFDPKAPPSYFSNKILPKRWESYIASNNKDKTRKIDISDVPVYEREKIKPVQPVVYQKPQEQKDYPIRGPLPKAQAKIQITAPQQYREPIPEGNYVFGPANSVIGINQNGKFIPYDMPEQRGKVNQADLDLMNNKEALSNFLRGKGLQFKRGGRFMGINPAHKGWCTPLSNPHCTGARRRLALTLKKYQAGGPVKGFDKNTVYVDKGKGKLYFYDDKGNFQQKEALTGKNRSGHILNPYTNLNTFSEQQKDAEKITPIGMFPLSAARDIYGNPGLDIMGTMDQRGQNIALHSTYDPQNRNKYYYNNNTEDNAQSYGCINCNKSDSDRIAKLYGNKKVYIYDSNLSDEENQKYNAVNNLIANDNSLYKKLAATFDKSKVVTYRKGSDGKLYNQNGSYDPVTQTMIPNKAMEEVVVRASRNKNIPKPTPLKEEPIVSNKYIPDAPLPSSNNSVSNVPSGNPSIVDYLNSTGANASFKNRAELAKSKGIEGYKGTADQNLKLLAMLRGENTDNPARRMKKGGRFMGINPEHKGWCTPLSNPHCTGARRRLALTLKKHHGFHGS